MISRQIRIYIRINDISRQKISFLVNINELAYHFQTFVVLMFLRNQKRCCHTPKLKTFLFALIRKEGKSAGAFFFRYTPLYLLLIP